MIVNYAVFPLTSVNSQKNKHTEILNNKADKYDFNLVKLSRYQFYDYYLVYRKRKLAKYETHSHKASKKHHIKIVTLRHFHRLGHNLSYNGSEKYNLNSVLINEYLMEHIDMHGGPNEYRNYDRFGVVYIFVINYKDSLPDCDRINSKYK